MAQLADNLTKIWSKAKYREGLHPQENAFFPIFLKIAQKADKILEVGAGDGRMIRVLKGRGVQAEFYAVDISPAVKKAPAKSQIADARDLPYPDNFFDLVYSLGVIEHFPETQRALQEQARVVKKGGYVLATTPHFGPQALMRWLRFWQKGDYKKGSYEEIKGRNLTLWRMRRYFRQAGLEVVGCQGMGVILGGPPWVNKFLSKVLPVSRFGDFLFCLGRKV